jgi:hypothetical protein
MWVPVFRRKCDKIKNPVWRGGPAQAALNLAESLPESVLFGQQVFKNVRQSPGFGHFFIACRQAPSLLWKTAT